MNIKNAETIRKLLRVFSFQQLIRDKGIRYRHLTQYPSLLQNILFVSIFNKSLWGIFWWRWMYLMSPSQILFLSSWKWCWVLIVSCISVTVITLMVGHVHDELVKESLHHYPLLTPGYKSCLCPATISLNRIDYVWSDMGSTDAVRQWKFFFGLTH